MPKLLCRPVAFGLVAIVTGECQVRRAITPTPAVGIDMVDLPAIGGRGLLMAVRTAIAPLEQQVLADFGASQRSMLIRDPSDIRVLQQLRIEAYCFEGEGSDGTPASQPLYPGDDVLHPTFQ